MTTTTKHLIPTLLLPLTVTLVVEAQPRQEMNGRGRGMQAGQNQQGPGMRSMNRGGHGPGPRQGGAPGMGVMHLLRQLDLTQEQHEVVRAIMDAHKEAAQAAHEAVQMARQSLHEAIIEEADVAAISAIATAMAQAVGDEAIQQVAVTKEIKNVLTDDQKTALAALISQAPDNHQRRPQWPPQGMVRGPARGRGQGRRPAGPDPT